MFHRYPAPGNVPLPYWWLDDDADPDMQSDRDQYELAGMTTAWLRLAASRPTSSGASRSGVQPGGNGANQEG